MDIPDEELDDEGKKEKRRQRLMKAGYDARERMKREKEEEKTREVSTKPVSVLSCRRT